MVIEFLAGLHTLRNLHNHIWLIQDLYLIDMLPQTFASPPLRFHTGLLAMIPNYHLRRWLQWMHAAGVERLGCSDGRRYTPCSPEMLYCKQKIIQHIYRMVCVL